MINPYRIKNIALKHIKLQILLLLPCITLAQTQVTSPMTGTPSPGDYYSYSGITLSPGFSFTAASGQSLHLYIAPAPDCQTLSSAPSNSQNYVVSYTPRQAGVTNPADPLHTSCEVMQTIQYFDGLGRPVQTIQVKGSTAGNDIVQLVVYDAFGREAVKYLPYTTSTPTPGSYRSNALSEQTGFYTSPPPGVKNMPTPYAQTGFEVSPLNRPVEQGAPGTPWQLSTSGITGSGHTVKTVYGTNTASTVTDTSLSYTAALYTATINLDHSHTLVRASGSAGYYAADALYVTITKDENWHAGRGGTTEEYKDKIGNVVLKRTYNYNGALQVLSTYYVYDDFGNLAFVLPPGSGADSAVPDQTILDNLCYQYSYDGRNRLAKKKVPGKGYEYIVYNNLDQVVATQDVIQRSKATQEWTFTKYDGAGRVAFTGIYQYPGSTAGTDYQPALQTTLDGQTSLWENPITTGLGYTATAWPQANITRILTLNFYDNYSFPGNPYTPGPTGSLTTPTGLLTGSKTNVLLADGTYGAMLWTVHYYDDKGRNMQTDQQHYLGGEAGISNSNYDEIAYTYDFTNEVTQTTRHHNTSASTTTAAVVIGNTYAYDHMGRKIDTYEAISTGSNPAPSPTLLSRVEYNEAGQLKTKHLHSTNSGSSFLQDIDYAYNERGWLKSSNAPLFAMQLNYNDGTTPQYNGNISNQYWGTPGSLSKNYTYSYDQLNRLTAGISNEGYNEQSIAYDEMGNITSLTRQSSAYTYNYTGNQLQSVSGLTSGTYTYDDNGNMHYDARNDKTVNYNLLNLPRNITATGFNLNYAYDANGQKLRKDNGTTVTDYISGIQYDNGAISFIQTDEGRAINSGGSYTYEYTLADHLGNSRVSFDQSSGTTVKQADDYYPFGMEISRGTVPSLKNEYLYNNKEKQEELGQYDYGARFYDPVIARWMSVDSKAEKYRRWSSYAYVEDNPVLMVDFDGMAADSSNKPKPALPPVELKEVKVTSRSNHSLAAVAGLILLRTGAQTGAAWGIEALDPEPITKTIGAVGLTLFSAYVITTEAIKYIKEKDEDVSTNDEPDAKKDEQDVPDGYKETKEFGKQHGQKVYKKGNSYISKDVDGHNGGKWKVFEKNGNKLKRVGTADKNLNIFKR